jgi:Cdc6-like AAA superfamily ATPase
MRRSERVDPATKERLLQRRLKAEAEKKALVKSLELKLAEEEEEEAKRDESAIVGTRNKSGSKTRKRSRQNNDKGFEDEDEEDEDDVIVEDDDVCGPRSFKWLGESLRHTEDGTRYFSSFLLGGVVFRLGDWISVASMSSSEKRKSGTSLSSEGGKKKKKRRSSGASVVSAANSSSSFCPGRIESIWSLKDGTKMCALSWCYLPNETTIGKNLIINSKSEVFISSHAEGIEIAAIDRRAKVLSTQQWRTRIHDAAEMRKRNELRRRLSLTHKEQLQQSSSSSSTTITTTTSAMKSPSRLKSSTSLTLPARDGDIANVPPPKSPSPSRRSGRLTPSMPTPTLGASVPVSIHRSTNKGIAADDKDEMIDLEDVTSEDEGDDGDAMFQVDPLVLHEQQKEAEDEEEDEEVKEDEEGGRGKEKNKKTAPRLKDDNDEVVIRVDSEDEEAEEKQISKSSSTMKAQSKKPSVLFSKFILGSETGKVIDRSPLRYALYWTRYFYDFGTKQVRALNQHELEGINSSNPSKSSIMSSIGPTASSSIAADIAAVFPLALRGHAITQQGGLGRSGPLPGLGIGLGVTSGTGAFTGAHTSSSSATSSSSSAIHGGEGVAGEEGSQQALVNRGIGSAGFGGALTGGDIFKRASKQLALSSAPPSMPCREGERKQLLDILDTAIRRGGLGQALYVSGMPGMGKTATMTEVVRELQFRNARGDLPDFNYVEVNAMKLSSPPALYTVLHRALTGVVLPPARACSALDARFSASSTSSSSLSSKKKKTKVEDLTTLLLVDELDFCVTRKQQVLYNLFEWPTRPGAKLIVVGIANVQDMPERLLPKVASRLGLGRITFSAYTAKQIETIVTARLQGIPAFSAEAVTMCAKKVCNSTGDVRRALHMCRRAVEIAKARVEAAEAAGLLPKGSSVGLVLPKTSSSSGGGAAAATMSAVKQLQLQQPSSSVKGNVSNNLIVGEERKIFGGSINPPTSPVMPSMTTSSSGSGTGTSPTFLTKASHFATPVAPPQPVSHFLTASASASAIQGNNSGRPHAPPPVAPPLPQVFSPASLNNPLAVRVTLDDLKAAASEISASVAQRAIGQTAPFERFLLVMLAEAVKRSNNNTEPRHLGELLLRGKNLVKTHCRSAFELAKAKEAAIVVNAAASAAATAATAVVSTAAATKSSVATPIIPLAQPTMTSSSSSSMSMQTKTPAAVTGRGNGSGLAINSAATSPTINPTPGGVAQRLSLSHVKSAPPLKSSSMGLMNQSITGTTTSPSAVIPPIASVIKATPRPPPQTLSPTVNDTVFVPNNRWEAAQRAWNDDPSASTTNTTFRSGPRMVSIAAYNPFPTAHDLLACAMRLDALKLIVCEWPRPGAEPLASALWDGKSYEEAKYKFGGGENERVILPPDMPFVSFGCIQPDDILLVLNEDPLVRVLRESGVL